MKKYQLHTKTDDILNRFPALRKRLEGALSPWQVPRDVWVGEIPATERGKISRRALAASYLARAAAERSPGGGG